MAAMVIATPSPRTDAAAASLFFTPSPDGGANGGCRRVSRPGARPSPGDPSGSPEPRVVGRPTPYIGGIHDIAEHQGRSGTVGPSSRLRRRWSAPLPTATAARDDTSSLTKMCARWLSTVFSLTTRSLAIWRFVMPSATRRCDLTLARREHADGGAVGTARRAPGVDGRDPTTEPAQLGAGLGAHPGGPALGEHRLRGGEQLQRLRALAEPAAGQTLEVLRPRDLDPVADRA